MDTRPIRSTTPSTVSVEVFPKDVEETNNTPSANNLPLKESSPTGSHTSPTSSSLSTMPLCKQDIWASLTEAGFQHVLLVVDKSNSMLLWHQFIDDLSSVAALLNYRSNMTFSIYELPRGDSRSQEQEVLEKKINDNEGLLILLVSDCVDQCWHNGTIGKMLDQWGRKHLVSILQVLPQWLWSRTALVSTTRVQIAKTGLPISMNSRLILEPLDFLTSPTRPLEPIAVPILPLEEHVLLQWVQAIQGTDRLIGYIFNAQPYLEQNSSELQEDSEDSELQSQEQILKTFSYTASLMARRLTTLLAAAPITLPLIRHLQQTVLDQHYGASDPEIIAEVLLGGLIEQLPAKNPFADPDAVRYDFIEDVREQLLDTLPFATSLQVLEETYNFFVNRFGPCVDITLDRLLANESVENVRDLDPRWRPFIEVASKVVRRMDSSYEKLADDLKRLAQLSDTQRSSRPYNTAVRLYHQDTIVERLHTLFTSMKGDLLNTVILQGADDADKQHLAAKYALYYRNRYVSTFWLRASSYELFFSDVSKSARSLGLEAASHPYSSATCVFKEQLEKHPQRFLLIISGLEENYKLNKSLKISLSEVHELFKEVLPQQGSGDILLLTTREITDLPNDRQEHIRTMRVGQTKIEEEVCFLLEPSGHFKQKLPWEDVTALQESANNICRLLQEQPYSIALARAYIRTTDDDVRAYGASLQNTYQELGTHYRDKRLVVRETLAAYMITIKDLEKNNGLAAAIIKLCVFFHREVIYLELLQYALARLPQYLQPDLSRSLSQSLDLLINLSLLYREADSRTYRIRPVIRKAQKEYTGYKQEDQRPWAICAVNSITTLFLKAEYKEAAHFQSYIPHAEECLETLQEVLQNHFPRKENREETTTILQMFTLAGEYLTKNAQYIQAQPFFEYALKISSYVFGVESLEHAACLNNMGEWSRLQHPDSEEAMEYLQKGWALYERFGKPEDPLSTSCLNNLALLYLQRGEPLEAEKRLQQALEIRRRLGDKALIARSLNNFAGFYFGQENYSIAKELFKEAREIRETVLGLDHPDTATVINNQGRVHQNLGQYEEADEYFRQSLSIREEFWSKKYNYPYHPDIANSYYSLGLNEYYLGDYTEAEHYLQRSLKIRQEIFKEDHADIVASLWALGEVCTRLNKSKEARSYLDHASRIRGPVPFKEFLDPSPATEPDDPAEKTPIQSESEFVGPKLVAA